MELPVLVIILGCTQPYPDLEKQPKWEVDVKPAAVDWDAEIADVLERGKDVPEVDWVEPGEDAAMEVILRARAVMPPLSMSQTGAT